MRTITKTELQEILRKHKLWLDKQDGGEKADLSYANLSCVDLSCANLIRANLSYANLSCIDLSYANLRYANLSCVDLSYANLIRANLSYANLRYADPSSANLSYANLSRVDLSSADLRRADLSNTGVMIFQFNKDRAIYTGDNKLRIGCEYHDLDYWVDNYKAIGAKNGYDSDEIKMYGKFIKECRIMYKEKNNG